jgi:hypothetical protein
MARNSNNNSTSTGTKTITRGVTGEEAPIPHVGPKSIEPAAPVPLTPQELAQRQLDLIRIREECKQLRRNADAAFGREKFDQLVRSLVEERVSGGAEETPALWISLARTVNGTCQRCQGTGVYHWGAQDQVTGHWTCSGQCYRCRGTGYQTTGASRRQTQLR